LFWGYLYWCVTFDQDFNFTNMSIDPNIEYQNGPRRGKVLAGVVLLAIGASLLLKQFDFFFFPSWLFSWPMWIIVWGIYIGANHNFRNSGWLVMVIIGLAFLLDRVIPGFNAGQIFWPVAIIGFGVFLILKRNHHNNMDHWDKRDWKRKWEYGKYNFGNPAPANPNEPVVDYTVGGTNPNNPSSTNPNTGFTGDDHLEAVSIFSKNFQGGEIVNVFGGAELDFTQADINGRVFIDVTQIFGGTKIIVPAHWMVISDMAAVFAGFDDKRIRTSAPLDSNKVLVLKGTSVFGGVDIRSY
jgi:predicted membrane protein